MWFSSTLGVSVQAYNLTLELVSGTKAASKNTPSIGPDEHPSNMNDIVATVSLNRDTINARQKTTTPTIPASQNNKIKRPN